MRVSRKGSPDWGQLHRRFETKGRQAGTKDCPPTCRSLEGGPREGKSKRQSVHTQAETTRGQTRRLPCSNNSGFSVCHFTHFTHSPRPAAPHFRHFSPKGPKGETDNLPSRVAQRDMVHFPCFFWDFCYALVPRIVASGLPPLLLVGAELWQTAVARLVSEPVRS